jgi:HTH-type transcriptional regulator/antitoxin HigA
MKMKRKIGDRPGAYLELIQRFPLRPIRTENELDRAIAIVDELTDREDLDDEEKDYLDVLSDLMERYEAKEHPMESVSDAVILAHLIEAKGTTQSKLAREAKIAESTISEILKGKRTLNRSQIGRLAHYFGIRPTVFRFTSSLSL